MTGSLFICEKKNSTNISTTNKHNSTETQTYKDKQSDEISSNTEPYESKVAEKHIDHNLLHT